MSDNFASLGAGLLARKGGAKPAMRPQVGIMPSNGAAAHNLEDLGWNDMGHDPEDEPSWKKRSSDVSQLTPEPANPEAEAQTQKFDEQAKAELSHDDEADTPIVHRQQEEIAEHFDTVSPFEQPEEEAEEVAEAPLAAVESIAEPFVQPEPSEPYVEAEPFVEEAPEQPVLAVKPKAKRKRRPAVERGKRAAFTLRLDQERHLKLRLACTIRNRSAQQLVTEALDDLLAKMTDVDSLAAQLRSTD